VPGGFPRTPMSTIRSTEAPPARLYGEPVQGIPADLYIPPDALRVFLDSFEGPLDLLLYLIRRQNFNVLDIPMAELTAQYLAYVHEIRRHDLELAGDYLLMAAVLIAIKSRMLLPPEPRGEEEEAADPRAELVRRLLEYERMRQAADHLDALPRAGRDFLWAGVLVAGTEMAPVLPGVSAQDLADAWRGLLVRARLHARHAVHHEALSVREHMSRILQRLSRERFIEFSALFAHALDRPDAPARVVVHFLALLELMRESVLEVTQAEAFAPIYIRLSSAQAAA